LYQWKAMLAAPRVGPIALDTSRGHDRPPMPERWQRGWHIPTQAAVLFRFGTSEAAATYSANAAVWRRVLVPSVARIVASGSDAAQRPYLAVEVPGVPLPRCLGQGARPSEVVRRRWLIAMVALFNALGQQGFMLPDASLYRYNVDGEGHLWLIDLWQLAVTEPSLALTTHANYARDICTRVLAMDVAAAPEPRNGDSPPVETELQRIVAFLEQG
ncbi:MAG TPA: hypothetical protein VIV60_07665, partial [Polyangiaceae bacterium]